MYTYATILSGPPFSIFVGRELNSIVTSIVHRDTISDPPLAVLYILRLPAGDLCRPRSKEWHVEYCYMVYNQGQNCTLDWAGQGEHTQTHIHSFIHSPGQFSVCKVLRTCAANGAHKARPNRSGRSAAARGGTLSSQAWSVRVRGALVPVHVPPSPFEGKTKYTTHHTHTRAGFFPPSYSVGIGRQGKERKEKIGQTLVL